MKTKKLLSLITVFCILAAMFTMMTVSADSAGDTTPNAPLGVSYAVNSWDGYTTDDFSITYSDDAKSGSYSLDINNINEVPNRWINVKIPFAKTAASGDTYKISFWLKATNKEMTLLLGTNWETVTNPSISAINEWVYCETEHTLANDAAFLDIRTWKAQRLFDDFQVRKVNGDGTYGENIALNGNFETIKDKDVVTAPDNWISAYGGNNISNREKMAGQNTFIALTDADAYSGEYSMLVNVYQELDNAVFRAGTNLKAGIGTSNYRLELYIKNVEDSPRASISNTGGNLSGGWGALYTGGSTSVGDGWYKKTFEWTGNGAGDSGLYFDFWPQGAILIDDVTLYELDESGNPTGSNLVNNSTFEPVVEIADPTVTLGESSNLGEYELIAEADGVADGKATYKVVINTLPFGRKAVITANGEAIAADTEYEVTEDTVVVVNWEDDGTDVLNALATAYEAEGEAAVFAKFNGTMPSDYGFVIDAFVGKKFGIDGEEYTAADGRLPATGNADGVFGIRIAGVEAGAYTAVPYAGEATADAIAFEIK